MRFFLGVILLFVAVAISVGCSEKQQSATQPTANAASPSTSTERPANWAQPLKVDGLPNLHKVSDDLYRSAQPTDAGIGNLKSLGVKTIVCLRETHSDAKVAKPLGLQYKPIPMTTWHPEDKEVVAFLRTVTDHDRTPVLVHCKHGSDRTGTMCAIYRIAVQGWTKDDAIREMTEGGYGFHTVWTNLIKYIKGLDIEQIKKEAGMEPATAK